MSSENEQEERQLEREEEERKKELNERIEVECDGDRCSPARGAVMVLMGAQVWLERFAGLLLMLRGAKCSSSGQDR